jgi:hypothetical protein
MNSAEAPTSLHNVAVRMNASQGQSLACGGEPNTLLYRSIVMLFCCSRAELAVLGMLDTCKDMSLSCALQVPARVQYTGAGKG